MDIQSGADISLYWGSSDGGTTSGNWENTVSIGKKSPKLALWLDASDLSTAGSTWSDKSGNANHATKNGSPILVTNAQNGHSLMHYTANAQYHDFTKIDDIRTVFWVVSQDPSVNGSGYRFLLNSGGYGGVHPGADFHNDNNGQFWGNSAHANIKSGTTWMNGSQLSGNVNYPNNLSIISLKTAGNVAANRFGQDRTHGGRQWIGRLGELIIFNTALTDSEIQKVEGYLAHKWGLAGTLPASHAYKQSSTMQGPKDLNSYTTDLSNLVPGNTYYYRVAATNHEGYDWADQTASFVSKARSM